MFDVGWVTCLPQFYYLKYLCHVPLFSLAKENEISVPFTYNLKMFFFPQESNFSLTKEQELWVVGIMLSVTLVKLFLVLYCRSFTNEIVKAYAQDHFFDVITNVIGLIAVLLANYVSDWMDPVGAIIVSTHYFK